MSPRDALLECLTRAHQGMGFVRTDLAQANSIAGPVEHLLVIEIIRDAVQLQVRIDNLRASVEQTRSVPQLKQAAGA